MYLVLKGGPTIYTKKFGTLKFFVEFLCVLVVVVAVVPMGGDKGKGERPRQKTIQFNFFLFDNHHEPILISIPNPQLNINRKVPKKNTNLGILFYIFHPLFSYILLFNNFYHPQLIDFSC